MIVHDCRQYTDSWWNVRRGVPTASEATRIVTPAKWQVSSQAEAYACELVRKNMTTITASKTNTSPRQCGTAAYWNRRRGGFMSLKPTAM